MISHLRISDFAIIHQLSVDFHDGLNILTGETGAGKSIIIEAISLALGSRADTTYIRTGKEKATIQIVFEGINQQAIGFMEENGIPLEDQLIVTREITLAGKSFCRINGQIVSVNLLNKLCKHLADIHGQYDHQSLLNPDNHIHFIDLYGSESILPVKEELAQTFKSYLAIKQQLVSIQRSESEALRHRDFMEFEYNEITGANLAIGEDEALSEEITLLQNGEKIFGNLEASYELMYESTPSTLTGLKRILDLLSDISDYSSELQQQKDVVSDCYYRLQDVATEIRKFKEGISFDQGQLDDCITRLDFIELLKRKYGGSIERILEYNEELKGKLETILHSGEMKEALTQELVLVEASLLNLCSRLSGLRKEISGNLENEINHQLRELNFKDALLQVSFSDKPPEENGKDQVEFLITTNVGEAPKPLAKIASGGEISRIMLAIKGILGDLDSIPTMIFDEIDSGISGITASIVGKKLLDISKEHQVLCITHLPQIAAYGNHNYKIEKHSDDHSTSTNIVPLDQEQKILEIARLTGGMSITEATIQNAKELIELSTKK